MLQVEIISDRLVLIPISMAYKEEIFREFTEEITTYMIPQPAKAISETESFITQSLNNLSVGTELVLVILKKDTQEFLGCTGIHQLNFRHPEIGIWLKKSVHGNGYGLEAVTVLKYWAEINLDYEYLIYPVDRANFPSKRIPESLGGEIVDEYQKINHSGNVLYVLEYRIPKSNGGMLKNN